MIGELPSTKESRPLRSAEPLRNFWVLAHGRDHGEARWFPCTSTLRTRRRLREHLLLAWVDVRHHSTIVLFHVASRVRLALRSAHREKQDEDKQRITQADGEKRHPERPVVTSPILTDTPRLSGMQRSRDEPK